MQNFLEIYNKMLEIRKKIGDSPDISFRLDEYFGRPTLFIRVDWWDDDFHCQKMIDFARLNSESDEERYLEYAIEHMKWDHKEFKEKNKK